MKKINIGQILFAGVVSSVAFLIVEFLFEGAVKLIFNFTEIDLAKQYFANIVVTGTKYEIVNILYLLCTCTITIWLYISLCPKFGEGIKTALIASLFVISVIVLFTINHINMGIFPLMPALISFIFSLIEFPLSIIAGTQLLNSKQPAKEI